MNFGVVVFPGSNCDRDCFYIIDGILKQPVKYVWHQDSDLDQLDCIVLPGGFSYGDYLRTGAIARFSPIMNSIIQFADKGGLVIGICNGFQILLEAGLLPGAMLRNRDVHFICKHLCIKVENIATPFTNLCQEDQVLRIPIAHNEGNYYIDKEGLVKLQDNRQIIFSYSNFEGDSSEVYNPNGSLGNIAGIINERGNVLGMMPHPERSSELALGSVDGLLIFNSIIEWFQERV
jgi:phosphoribosylformylglycinamidine synthase subunit PurQ / glutaminase